MGITLNLSPLEPSSSSAASYQAARHFDGYLNLWFLDPLYGRHYPADMTTSYIEQGYLPNSLDFVRAGDLETTQVQADFLGVNYYRREIAGETEP